MDGVRAGVRGQADKREGVTGLKRWAKKEDQILRDFGSRGARYCATLISKSCHTSRSVGAVQMRASRLGVSLYPVQVCPQCGRKVARLQPTTGLCDLCHERSFVPPVRVMADAMREVQRNESDAEYLGAIADAKRARARERKRRQRARLKES